MKFKGILIASLLLISSPVFAAPDVNVNVSGDLITFACDPDINPGGFDGTPPNAEAFYFLDSGDQLQTTITGCFQAITNNGQFGLIDTPFHFVYVEDVNTPSPEPFGSSYYTQCTVTDPEIGTFSYNFQTTPSNNSACRNWTPTPPTPTTTPSWMPPPGALLASVVGSVQTTGALIWPLYVFVGLMIAFYLANKIGDFFRESFIGFRTRGDVPQGRASVFNTDIVILNRKEEAERIDRDLKETRSGKYTPGTEDEYPKNQREAIVEAVEIYDKAHPDT